MRVVVYNATREADNIGYSLAGTAPLLPSCCKVLPAAHLLPGHLQPMSSWSLAHSITGTPSASRITGRWVPWDCIH
jgi:hypothetical protein